MMNLSCTLHFLSVAVEPYDATQYMVILLIPSAFGIFFGWLLDSLPFSRRAHLLFSSFLQFAASLAIPWCDDIFGFVLLCATINLSRSWIKPAIESVRVQQMTKDSQSGAEDLHTFGFLCQAVGALVFALLGGAI
jgi:hypothetical protein